MFLVQKENEMGHFFELLRLKTGRFFSMLKLRFVMRYGLKPHIRKLTGMINKVVNIRREHFPYGKSILKVSGSTELFFVIFNHNQHIGVTEVYDNFLNPLPKRYSLLKIQGFNELIPSEPENASEASE